MKATRALICATLLSTLCLVGLAAHAASVVIATIPVGAVPEGVAHDPNTNRIYVSNSNGASFSVIDGNTNAVITTVSTSANPGEIAFNPANGKIYVAQPGANRIQVFDSSTYASLGTVSVGRQPWGIAVNPNNNRVYTANYQSDSVSVIDSGTDTELVRIGVGRGPRGVGVNPTTDRIYSANFLGNSASVIDGGTNSVISTIALPGKPSAAFANKVMNRIYLANSTSNNVSVIDGGTNSIIANVVVGTNPRAVGVSHLTGAVYVANAGSNNVSIMDGYTNTVSETVVVGNSPIGISVNPATNRAYVANSQSNTVSVIDSGYLPPTPITVREGNVAIALTSNRVFVGHFVWFAPSYFQVFDRASGDLIAEHDLGKIFPWSIEPFTAQGKVTASAVETNRVSIFSADSGSLLTEISLPWGFPRGIAADQATGRAFVATAGGLVIVDVGSGSVIGQIPIPGYPADAAFDPGSGLVYVTTEIGKRVVVADPATTSVVAESEEVAAKPLSIAIDGASNRLYVADLDGQAVIALDKTNLDEIGRTVTDYKLHTAKLNPNDGRIYAASMDSQYICVIESSTMSLLEEIALPMPGEMALDPGAGVMYQTSYSSTNLALLGI